MKTSFCGNIPLAYLINLLMENVRDLRQGYHLADKIAHAMTPIMSHAH